MEEENEREDVQAAAMEGPDEDQAVEATEPEPEPEAAEEVEHDLEKLLEDVKRERDEYLELAQRTKADFENYRKRIARDISEAQKKGVARIVLELLPVVDNLERALEAAKPRDRDLPESHISEGVRLVFEEITGCLKRSGITSFQPEGERFDPNLHEAVMSRPADDVEDGTIIEVLEKGYRHNEAVLRPAKVVVAQQGATA